MKYKSVYLCVLLFVGLNVIGLYAQANPKTSGPTYGKVYHLPLQYKGFIPKNGIVPDSVTAVKIAEAIWLPVYGKEIYNEQPFTAKINNKGIWIVEGSLPEGAVGGTAYAEIRKKDGKVIKINHFK
jgi:hypothetical protein